MDNINQSNKDMQELIEIIHFTENVSSKIYGCSEPEDIYRILNREFINSNKYTMSILLFTEDKSALRVVESSVSAQKEKVREGERVAKTGLKNYKLALNRSKIYSRVVKRGETFQVKVDNILSELFPPFLSSLILKIFGYKSSYCILTPLFLQGKITGAFAMSSHNLSTFFIPSVKNLAKHISIALELCHERKKQKVSEAKIKELSSAVEQSIDGIAISDFELKFTYVNRAFAEMYGYLPEEMLGMHFYRLYNKDQIDEYWKRVNQTKKMGSWEGEMECTHKNNIPLTAYMSVTLLRDEEGKPSGFLAAVKDISQYKMAEIAIQESTLRLKEKKEELERKNIALKEILTQLELEKREIENRVAQNIKKLIIPTLINLKNINGMNDTQKNYIKILEMEINNILSNFAQKISGNFIKLSPREIEICKLIKNNYSNKEIASMLFLSLLTIERHRHNIRKKLGIDNKKINLKTYLNEL